MGNRAVITTNKNLNDVGIYVHWNGGRDSVEAFLAYCDLKGYRKPEEDCYEWACLTRVISNFFGYSDDDGLSIGVDIAHRLDCDNYDNGVYIIKNWRIVDRLYNHGEEYYYDMKRMLEEIDEAQPIRMRLTKEQWAKFDEVYNDVKKYRKHTKRDATGKFCKEE